MTADSSPGGYRYRDDTDGLDYAELAELYRVAPLGDKPPDLLRMVFGNSMFACFVYSGDRLVGAGRALADGVDCAYIADVAVHPDHQRRGLGRAVVQRLAGAASGHKKIILYANPGAEPFYASMGFLPMRTAMAIWRDPAAAVEAGILAAQL